MSIEKLNSVQPDNLVFANESFMEMSAKIYETADFDDAKLTVEDMECAAYITLRIVTCDDGIVPIQKGIFEIWSMG